jgi:group II intron reverse transcriptase/maturase
MIEIRNTKTQPISRRQVWRAYKSLKGNGKAAGLDGLSLQEFEKDKEKQIYKIWNRMSSGSYFPPPIRAVEIPKKDGGIRKLGLPTVGDRIAQMVVKHQIESRFEKIFHEDSYAYRPKTSAHEAIQAARERCLEFDWGIDMDIKGFFDNIDHELIMKCLYPYVSEKWVLIYIERWLKAPIIDQQWEMSERTKGTPQGGVISPLLANIFLHFVFDKWMVLYHPENKFERYADDIIIHCKTKEEAVSLLENVKTRMKQCKLELHPGKTKIFYCKDYRRKEGEENVSFTFLSHTFKPRRHKSKYGKGWFLGYSPAISILAKKDKISKIKEMYQQFFIIQDIRQIAKYVNSRVGGWIAYYGRANFWKIKVIFDNLNFRLAKWLKRQNKKLKYSLSKAFKYLRRIQKNNPLLFVHWRHGFTV